MQDCLVLLVWNSQFVRVILYKCTVLSLLSLHFEISSSWYEFFLGRVSPSADRNLVTDDTLCQQIEDSLVFLISSTHKVAVSFLRLLYSNIIFSNLLLQRSFADGFHAAKYWTSFFRTPDSVQYLSMLIKFVVIKHIVCMLEYCLWEIWLFWQ